MILFVKFDNQRGFTLIETLISLFILALIVMSFMMTHSQSHIATRITKHRSAAIRLAQQRIEALKRMDQPGYDRNFSDWASEIGTTKSISLDDISYQITTTYIPDSVLPSNIQTNINIVPIRITVNWIEPNLDTYSIFMDTFYIAY